MLQSYQLCEVAHDFRYDPHIYIYIKRLTHTNFTDFLKSMDQFQIQIKCSPDKYNFRDLLLYAQFHKAF